MVVFPAPPVNPGCECICAGSAQLEKHDGASQAEAGALRSEIPGSRVHLATLVTQQLRPRGSSLMARVRLSLLVLFASPKL